MDAKAAGFTTTRYDEDWGIVNPGRSSYLPTSYDGLQKFYERAWWSGIDLPGVFITSGIFGYCISEEKAKECAPVLRDRYPSLSVVCDYLDRGETWFVGMSKEEWIDWLQSHSEIKSHRNLLHTT